MNASMFRDAHNTSISGGSFTINTGEAAIKSGLKLLQDNIASGAFHDSDERFDPPKCHPRTREAVIAKIRNWIKTNDRESFFLWLYGPAGAGKSAIAQTIAELCFEEEEAAASFFFSRSSDERKVETFLISTLVYQLTLSIPEIRDSVGIVMENDPKLLSRTLKSQAKALIIRPLNELAQSAEGRAALQARPRFIIIDGLDECLKVEGQQYVLDVLSAIVTELTVRSSSLLPAGLNSISGMYSPKTHYSTLLSVLI
ncbi:hypothetical protein CPB84DRAFT_1175247 [Gymnopilus junonius]|uniref:Nephrocystin 3-like N-terminal domain-containing protein n=1 Tax=Gymnopilus junonius TaxID=109634 RepID=A0A9P5NJ84_GYMJU|nr:hypothetical protein CPB84DRAFT_1175247 [Gymnopilus junonius]